MADLSATDISIAGTALSLASAAAGGDTFPNPEDNRTFFMVTNGGGGSITVTFDAVPTSVQVAGFGAVPVADTAVAVAAGATRVFGPFPPQRFNTAAGRVAVTYSGVSSVTVGAFRLPAGA